MKILYIIILFIILYLPACEGKEYIDTYGNDQKILNELPMSLRFRSDSKLTTGNFRQLVKNKPHILIREGFREITVDNSPAFDSDIQTAGGWVVTVFADHAEKTRTVSNKSLNVAKKEKGRAIIAGGMAILNAKYDNDWESGYDADKATLKNYFINTIRPLIIAASTLQEVKNLNNGDEYTWPTL